MGQVTPSKTHEGLYLKLNQRDQREFTTDLITLQHVQEQ